MEKRKSILLVTADCLRADHVSFMGYARPTSPFLDSLAQESFVFPTAIVAGAPTFYSFPAILASRYPLALGRDVVGLGPDEPTLASVAQKAGYATASFGAANPYVSSRFGYDRGFDTFQDFLQEEDLLPEQLTTPVGTGWTSRVNRVLRNAAPKWGPVGDLYEELYFRYCQCVSAAPTSLDSLRRYPSADVVVDQACAWLSTSSAKPFFLWLHLMDPHGPYYPKEQALTLMGDGPVPSNRARYLNSYWNRGDLAVRRFARYRDEVVRLYDAGIRWVDEQVRRLIGTLRRMGLWDDCIFAFTADHGEEFLDHGGRFHPPSRLTEELIHVPLLLRAPGAIKGQLNRSPFSLIHLAPTILDAAQLPIPSEFMGRSYKNELVNGGELDGVTISESVARCSNPMRRENRMGSRVLSIRESRFKLLLQFEPKAEFLYDLEEDPGENHPIAASEQKAARRRLLEIAREHLHSSHSGRNLKPRLQQRLRDLRIEWQIPAEKASTKAS